MTDCSRRGSAINGLASWDCILSSSAIARGAARLGATVHGTPAERPEGKAAGQRIADTAGPLAFIEAEERIDRLSMQMQSWPEHLEQLAELLSQAEEVRRAVEEACGGWDTEPDDTQLASR